MYFGGSLASSSMNWVIGYRMPPAWVPRSPSMISSLGFHGIENGVAGERARRDAPPGHVEGRAVHGELLRLPGRRRGVLGAHVPGREDADVHRSCLRPDIGLQFLVRHVEVDRALPVARALLLAAT